MLCQLVGGIFVCLCLEDQKSSKNWKRIEQSKPQERPSGKSSSRKPQVARFLKLRQDSRPGKTEEASSKNSPRPRRAPQAEHLSRRAESAPHQAHRSAAGPAAAEAEAEERESRSSGNGAGKKQAQQNNSLARSTISISCCRRRRNKIKFSIQQFLPNQYSPKSFLKFNSIYYHNKLNYIITIVS